MKFLKILSLAALSLILANAAQAQEKVGVIKAFLVKGDVSLVNNATGATSPLKRGQEFGEGSTVVTSDNGSALLLFSNGASVNVTPNSRYNIADFEQASYDPALGSFLLLEKDPSMSKTTTNLEYGEVVGEVRKLALDKGSTFTVNTPVASAGIRGTVWVVSYNAQTGQFTATNVTGDVVVMVDGQTISVPAGESYVIFNNEGSMEEADPAVLQRANEFLNEQGLGDFDTVVDRATIVTTPNTTIISDSGQVPSLSEPVFQEQPVIIVTPPPSETAF